MQEFEINRLKQQMDKKDRTIQRQELIIGDYKRAHKILAIMMWIVVGLLSALLLMFLGWVL